MNALSFAKGASEKKNYWICILVQEGIENIVFYVQPVYHTKYTVCSENSASSLLFLPTLHVYVPAFLF